MILLLSYWQKRFKKQQAPKRHTKEIDGASVIMKLHIPGFCCKSHYTHARYIYSTEKFKFCVGRGVLTPFQWICQCKKGVLSVFDSKSFVCSIEAFFF